MKGKYISLIKDVFDKEGVKNLEFIQGLPVYNFLSLNINPLNYKKRPYVVYQGTKNNLPIILKLLIRQNYIQFFKRELFAYQNIPKIIPQSNKILPELISFSEKPIPYLIIKYYQNWENLGEYNLLSKPITIKQLEMILNSIVNLNWSKTRLENKARQLGLSLPFVPTETYSFYFNRFQKETKNSLIKFFGIKTINRLMDLFKQTKIIFINSANYYCWGDANPANIIINPNNQSQFEFRFIDFEKTGYSYLARDYTTLYYAIYLKNSSLALFLKNWLMKKFKDTSFWQIFYFKLLIYSLPRQFTYFGQKHDLINQKKIVDCAKISFREYLKFF